MPSLVLGLEPHPAMDRSLLLPPSASKSREKGSHYPSAYLKSVTPLPNEINRVSPAESRAFCACTIRDLRGALLSILLQPIDAIGYVAMKFISLVSSLLAWWLPLWLVETSPLLSTQAWLRSPAEVIFLRRILILEVHVLRVLATPSVAWVLFQISILYRNCTTIFLYLLYCVCTCRACPGPTAWWRGTCTTSRAFSATPTTPRSSCRCSPSSR